MRSYPHNSPEAMARIVSMCIMADSDIDASEFNELQPAFYEAIGITQPEFMRVLAHYLEDVVAEAGNERINLLQPERVNTLLAEVSERPQRINTSPPPCASAKATMPSTMPSWLCSNTSCSNGSST